MATQKRIGANRHARRAVLSDIRIKRYCSPIVPVSFDKYKVAFQEIKSLSNGQDDEQIEETALEGGLFTTPLGGIGWKDYFTETGPFRTMEGAPITVRSAASLVFEGVVPSPGPTPQKIQHESSDGYHRVEFMVSQDWQWQESSHAFMVEGQGTVIFKLDPTECSHNKGGIRFKFTPQDDGEPGCKGAIVVYVGEGDMKVTYYREGSRKLLGHATALKFDCSREQTYWVSFNKAGSIKVGWGSPDERFSELSIDLKNSSLLTEELRQAIEKVTRKLKVISTSGSPGIEIEYLKQPVTKEWSPLLVGGNQGQIGVLESTAVTRVTELSQEIKLLYEDVNKLDLSKLCQGPGEHFKDFGEAIEYSIATEGALCNEMIKNKAGLAGSKYLRITVGDPSGLSPGAQYVLEIWPPGNGSPIHSHSNANAVIKVLRGCIRSEWFRSLHHADTNPFQSAILHTGEITWLNRRFFQTHRLYNFDPITTCITIQSYKYNDTDNTHYEKFDYLDKSGEKHGFEPNSDMEFSEFVKKLYDERKQFKEEALKIKR